MRRLSIDRIRNYYGRSQPTLPEGYFGNICATACSFGSSPGAVGAFAGGVEFDGALTTGFTYQPGGGVDVRVTPKVGIRLQGDYRVIRTQGVNGKQSRFLVGVVYRSGQL